MTKLEGKWFEKSETSIRGRWVKEPYQNIFIGSDPRDGSTKEDADQFDAIINVSCTHGALFEPSRPDQRTYWYPVNEGGEWSYAYFLMMFKIIEHHFKLGHKIYIHCHAGAYRSPSIFKWWLVASQNKTIQQANEIEWGASKFPTDPYMQHYSNYQNYILGNIPPNFQVFIERIRVKGIENANFTSIICQPNYLSDRPEVQTQRHFSMEDLIHKIKYRIRTPFRRLLDIIDRWGKDRIEIRTGAFTLVTSDWKKAANKRPKRNKA